MIRSNAHKYSISALCKCLDIAHSTYYYELQGHSQDKGIETEIEEIFNKNRQVYGSRKIKAELLKRGQRVSRRRICRIMKKLNLESAYSKSRFKVHGSKCNEASLVYDAFASVKANLDEIITWSEMYDTAGFEAKKMIVNCLISKVEVYRGYKLHIDFKIDLDQFSSGLDIVA